uniref:CPBP family intramembrane glutamic endopeptidase n=1 Tax=Clostridium sp. TaxID=1506 RepID=UPI00321647C1
KRIKSIERYIISLVIVTFINLIFLNKKLLVELLLVLIVPILLFVYEFYMINNTNKNKKIIYEIKNIYDNLIILLAFPVLEEILYRYILLDLSNKIGFHLWQYFVLSVLAFVFVHFFTQGLNSLKKGTFAFIQCVIMVYSKNIFICITLHIVFNLIVYLYKSNNYRNQKGLMW